MSTYVIAKKSPLEEEVDLLPGIPDFEDKSVVAIFSDHRAANDYVRKLGGHEYEVVPLSAMELLRWMVRAYEQGTHYLVVNRPPPWKPDDRRGRLAIEQQLAHFAELLTRDVVACAESVRQRGSLTR